MFKIVSGYGTLLIIAIGACWILTLAGTQYTADDWKSFGVAAGLSSTVLSSLLSAILSAISARNQFRNLAKAEKIRHLTSIAASDATWTREACVAVEASIIQYYTTLKSLQKSVLVEDEVKECEGEMEKVKKDALPWVLRLENKLKNDPSQIGPQELSSLWNEAWQGFRAMAEWYKRQDNKMFTDQQEKEEAIKRKWLEKDSASFAPILKSVRKNVEHYRKESSILITSSSTELD